MKRCFFIGHREADDSIYQALYKSIEEHIIKFNVEEFVVGQYGGFDCLVRKALIEAKQNYPHIRLLLLMPYLQTEHDKTIPNGFDDSIYPEGLESVPRRYAIVRANRYMVDHSDYLIAYVAHPASNAYNLVEYANRIKRSNTLTVTNILEIPR